MQHLVPTLALIPTLSGSALVQDWMRSLNVPQQ